MTGKPSPSALALVKHLHQSSRCTMPCNGMHQESRAGTRAPGAIKSSEFSTKSSPSHLLAALVLAFHCAESVLSLLRTADATAGPPKVSCLLSAASSSSLGLAR